jgi:hypothetical protein
LSCLKHLVVEILLYQVLEFLIELFRIDGLAERRAGNGVTDFLAESVLFAEFFPSWERLS